MADVEVSYKGSTIGSLSASGTLALETEGTWCEDDITVDYTSPGGGGGSGATKVAYGSFTGNSTNGRMTILVGKKMPQTDFFMVIKAQNNTEFARNSDYTFVDLCTFLPSVFGSYDLSADSDAARPFTSAYTVKDNNSGTITDKTAGRAQKIGLYIRSGSLQNFAFDTFSIYRTAADAEFSIWLGQGNSAYKWPSTVTYDWEIWYFGSNSGTDIVTIP